MSIAHHFFFFLNTSAQLCSSTEIQHMAPLRMAPLLFQAVFVQPPLRAEPASWVLLHLCKPRKNTIVGVYSAQHCIHVDEQHLCSIWAVCCAKC